MEELDVTKLSPRDKHPTIHRRLSELIEGQALRIFNDHDPRPLRFELDADFPGVYSWDYVDTGPEVWRVDIRRRPTGGAPLVQPETAFLDVRPFHARHEEPYDAIMEAVDALLPGQALELVNSFEPTPLLRVMGKRGFAHSCSCAAPDEYHVIFTPRT